MDIRGMDMLEISKKLQPYVVDYFKDCKLYDLDEPMFAESYEFDFTEVKHLIPAEYHSMYKDSDLFRGSSGYILFDKKSDRFKGSIFIVMLIADAESSEALFLYLQEESDITHEQKDILIADFQIRD